MYFIAVLYISTVLGSYGYQYFALFLKNLKNADGTKVWRVTQVNAIPIGGSAIQVVFGRLLRALISLSHANYLSVWIWAFLSDFLGTRWILIVAQGNADLHLTAPIPF